MSTTSLPSPQVFAITEAAAHEIAVEAYIYAFPLVLMEITRRISTNVVRATVHQRAPHNQFSHAREFPDATYTDLARGNCDTLYSTAWLDVTHEPVVISVPSSDGRYYLLPMLDMWSDVFASPGLRTTGDAALQFAVCGPKWQGTLPSDVDEIRSPTGYAWLIGRTQACIDDYQEVHRFQDRMTITPLSMAKTRYRPPLNRVDTRLDLTPPLEQVLGMNATLFFEIFTRALRHNPPHANDYPVLARMRRIGLRPGRTLDWPMLPIHVKAALLAAPEAALPYIQGSVAHTSRFVNGWVMLGTPIGTYGTDYLKRAGIAYYGLGANCIEDALYATIDEQTLGAPLDSARPYIIHFDRAQLPPARAFWSITMYDRRQLLVGNELNRFTLGDREHMHYNRDGSLDIYLQRTNPGPAHEANWLPTPAAGAFSLTMRLYWPRPGAWNGTWSPPPVKFNEGGDGKREHR